MKNIYIIFLSILGLALTACEQEELEFGSDYTSVNSDAIPVNISFSMNHEIEKSTDYIPMRSGTSTYASDVRVQISNIQRAIIAKKVGNRWLFETISDYIIDPSDKYNLNLYDITNSTVVGPFEAELTPGIYKATVITGVTSTNWDNTKLKKGDLLGYTDDTPFDAPFACTYLTIAGNGYLNIGSYGLNEEIFAGSAEFEVKKTEDLHSPVYPNSVLVTLYRKVTKLRIALECDPDIESGIGQFFHDQTNGIVADLQGSPTTPFCNGINVWGEPYYDPNEVISAMKYGVFTVKKPQLASNGSYYLIGMKSTRQFSCFYFSDPQIDIPITISNIDISANSGMPRYISEGKQISGLTLKHNQMTGFILQSGENAWKENHPIYGEINYRDLIEVKDGSNNLVLSNDLFDFPHEYANVGE